MNKDSRLKGQALAAAVAVLSLAGMLPARAAPPLGVQLEVNFLLGYIEGSGCEFQRNGSWHTSPAAQRHLRGKFDFLSARNLIQTTEQFIDKAATESSLSSQPYTVRCNGGATVPSGRWLHDELARYRKLP